MPEKIEVRGQGACLTIEMLTSAEIAGDRSRASWDNATIRAEVSGFAGALDAEILLVELQQFAEDLKRLYKELSGGLRLTLREGVLDLSAEMDPLGHIQWTVDLSPWANLEHDSHLHFEMQADQSYLPALIEEVEAAQAQGRLAE